MSDNSKLALLSGVAVALLSSGSALAQEQSTGALDEVVVTATRSETNLQRTPVAVTALSEETLVQRNITSFLDLNSQVPSLSIGSRAGTGAAAGGVALRGMGVDSQDSQSSVGTYVDEVYFAGARGNILGLMDTQRVEVLRGPQGTLFGRNTIAGAIQYVTRAPEDEFGGYVLGTVGSLERRDITGVINVPVTDTLAIRVAAMHAERDGYVRDEANGIDRGSLETLAGRFRARWEPTSNLSVDFKTEYIEQDTNGRALITVDLNPNAAFVAPFLTTPALINQYLSYIGSPNELSFGGFDEPDYFKFNHISSSLTVNYDINENLTFKSITGYGSYRSRLAQDFDNVPMLLFSSRPPVDNTQVLTQEFQLRGDTLSDRLNYTLGVYYYDSSQRIHPNYQLSFGGSPPAAVAGDPAFDTKALAVYARANYTLTDQLSIDLGARYSEEEIESWLINETTPLTTEFDNISPHLGVNLQATEDLLFYVKASRGFRAGGFAPNRSVTGGGNFFDPETAWTYEVGARSEWADGRLRINPTFFFTSWKDIQFNQLVFPGPGLAAVTTLNAGDAEIQGFELESEFAVTEQFRVTGTVSVLDAHYTRVSPGLDVTLDSPLMQVPELKYSFGGSYTFPLAGDGSVVASANYSWTDEQESAVLDRSTMRLPDFHLVNARLQYNAPGDGWSLAAFGTNLTDEIYFIGGSAQARGATAGADLLDPGRPQEYGVELKVNF